MAGKITVTYFKGVKARGTPIKVPLHYAGLPFIDNNIAFGDWAAVKAETPGGALPTLSIDGKGTFTQSLALARYAARMGAAADPTKALYPIGSDAASLAQALAIDEVMDLVQEILTKTPQDPDKEKKQAMREEYAAGPMKAKVDFLASKVTGDDGFITGPDFTLADVVLYYFLLEMLRSGQFDYVAADYIDAWPVLTSLEQRIKTHPAISGWEADVAKAAE